MQPIELDLSILGIVSSHAKGASTYKIYRDLEATGFRNKPRVMKFINNLEKRGMLHKVPISEKKKAFRLTEPGKLVVDINSVIKSFFVQYEKVVEAIETAYGSQNDGVLRRRGWLEPEVKAKQQYFGTITYLQFTLGIVFQLALFVRFSKSVMMLGGNKSALEMLSHLFLNAMQKYYANQPLQKIKVVSSDDMLTASKDISEFERNFVLDIMNERTLSRLKVVDPKSHPKIMHAPLGELQSRLYDLVAPELPPSDLGRALDFLQTRMKDGETSNA